MAQTEKVEVHGEVLKWAREQRGLTLEAAAKRLDIPVDRLLAFESNEESPTFAKLEMMEDQYKRPLIVLLLDKVPETYSPLKDFRSAELSSIMLSPFLHDEILRAEQQQDVFKEIHDELEIETDEIDLPVFSSESQVATDLCNLLRIDEVKTSAWKQPNTAYSQWRTLLESIGILIIETARVEISEMRGFSLSEKSPKIIGINGGDAPRGKTFTLLHELAHLCLRNGGLCDVYQSSSTINVVEKRCNAIAAHMLLNDKTIKDSEVVVNHDRTQAWTDVEIISLQKLSFGASEEVVSRRLLELKLMSRDEYEKRRKEYLAVYAELKKNKKKSKGGPLPHNDQIRKRGRPFIRTVFDAYSEGVITISDLAELSGVRTKHLKVMREEVFS